jgi:hypothetical protein
MFAEEVEVKMQKRCVCFTVSAFYTMPAAQRSADHRRHISAIILSNLSLRYAPGILDNLDWIKTTHLVSNLIEALAEA